MKRISILVLSILIAEPIIGARTTQAQHIYNKTSDDQAQAALAIAATLQSDSLFDKQLKNLSLVAKRDMETSLAAARVSTRAEINSFTNWDDVETVVRSAETRIHRPIGAAPGEVQTELDTLDATIKEANAAYEKLKQDADCKKSNSADIDLEKCPAQKPGQLDAFFDRVGELDDIRAAVDTLRGSLKSAQEVMNAAKKASEVVGQLKTIYESYAERIQDYNKLKGVLLDLQLPLKKVALQALQTDEQHLKFLLKIQQRREAEEANILELIGEFAERRSDYRRIQRNSVIEGIALNNLEEAQSPAHATIEMELRDLVAKLKFRESALDKAKLDLAAAEDLLERTPTSNGDAIAQHRAEVARARQENAYFTDSARELRDELSDKLFTLYLAAAISARAGLPAKFADLRIAQEQHAYSIRKSAVLARGYQATISSGVSRLALYHKGGIKPSVVAQLVHAVATVAIPPLIAAN
jgi:hypothetical protein